MQHVPSQITDLRRAHGVQFFIHVGILTFSRTPSWSVLFESFRVFRRHLWLIFGARGLPDFLEAPKIMEKKRFVGLPGILRTEGRADL